MDDDGIKKSGDGVDSFMKEQIDRHQKRMKRAIENLEDRMIRLYGRIKTDDSGVIKGPQHTLKQVQQIHSRLALEFEETYGKAVNSLAEGLDEVEEFVHENLSYLGVKGELPRTDRVLLTALWEGEFERFTIWPRKSSRTFPMVFTAPLWEESGIGTWCPKCGPN